jgi:hypothetical protein
MSTPSAENRRIAARSVYTPLSASVRASPPAPPSFRAPRAPASSPRSARSPTPDGVVCCHFPAAETFAPSPAAARPARATRPPRRAQLARPADCRAQQACATPAPHRLTSGASAARAQAPRLTVLLALPQIGRRNYYLLILFLPSSYLGEWRRPTPSQMGAHIRRSVGGSQRTHLQRRQFQAGRAGAGGSTRQSRAGRLPRSSRCRAPSLWARRFLRDRGSTERSCCSGSDSRRAHSMKGGRRTRAM